MIDERDKPHRERLGVLYDKVLQKRNPGTEVKANSLDIDAVLDRFKKLHENMIEASKQNEEHPISAVIDYLMVVILENYINRREDAKKKEEYESTT